MGRLTHSRRATAYFRSLRNVIAHWYGAPSEKQLIGDFPPLLLMRLRLLGLDPTFVAVAQPETLRRLSATCRNCAHTASCATDLGADNAAAGMDGYCANGDMIDDLVIKRANG